MKMFPSLNLPLNSLLNADVKDCIFGALSYDGALVEAKNRLAAICRMLDEFKLSAIAHAVQVGRWRCRWCFVGEYTCIAISGTTA
jgi:hypothetical protein